MSIETHSVSHGGAASFMRKKVGGVPVVYLVAGFVLVLVILAWRLKTPSDPADATATAADPALDGGGGAVDTSGEPSTVYPNMPSGTVVVAPQADPVNTDPPVETNTDWLKKAVLYLVNTKNHGAGEAQQALSLYLDGENLTYAQGVMRDEALKQFGLPPDPGSVGTTGPKPVPVPTPVPKPSVPVVARQGTPPVVHTVRGVGDNTVTELIHLYYSGSATNDKYDLIQNANQGIAKGGPYKVGTKIFIPAYHAPKYYVATKTTVTASAIAMKNGTSVKSLGILNDGMRFPVKVGTKVRVS